MTIGIILIITGHILMYAAGYYLGQREGQKRAQEAYEIKLARQLGSSSLAARAAALRRLTTPCLWKGSES